MKTFLEYETMCREPPCGHVFVESVAEIDIRKVAEAEKLVVRHSRHKNNASATHFFHALSETHSAISLETCKAKFHPNLSKFPRFI